MDLLLKSQDHCLVLTCRFQHLTVVVDALVSSLDVLGMLAFLLLVVLIVFSTIIYYIESGTNEYLNSIPQTMYYIQVSGMTVWNTVLATSQNSQHVFPVMHACEQLALEFR